MLRVVVESASGLPKKKLGSPDPITSVGFKGKHCGTHTLTDQRVCFLLDKSWQMHAIIIIYMHD